MYVIKHRFVDETGQNRCVPCNIIYLGRSAFVSYDTFTVYNNEYLASGTVRRLHTLTPEERHGLNPDDFTVCEIDYRTNNGGDYA